MLIHHYHPVTGDYCGTTAADLDPVESRLADEERYLMPAHATAIAPPELAAGETARWAGAAWQVIPAPAPPEPEPAPTLQEVMDRAVETVRWLRVMTLDRFVLQSPGVAEVYRENLEAVRRYQAGDTTPLRSGLVAAEHLAALAEEVPHPTEDRRLTVEEFAAYVTAEHLRLGPNTLTIEREYLATKIAIAAAADTAAIATAVAAYQALCESVATE